MVTAIASTNVKTLPCGNRATKTAPNNLKWARMIPKHKLPYTVKQSWSLTQLMSFCWPMMFCSHSATYSATCLFSPSWNIHISRNGGNRGEQARRPLQKCGAATSAKPISRQNTQNGLVGLQDSEKNLFISAKFYTDSSVLHQNPLAQFSARFFSTTLNWSIQAMAKLFSLPVVWCSRGSRR